MFLIFSQNLHLQIDVYLSVIYYIRRSYRVEIVNTCVFTKQTSLVVLPSALFEEGGRMVAPIHTLTAAVYLRAGLIGYAGT